MRYKLRLILGFVCALFISLSNLVLLSGFIPLINTITTYQAPQPFTLSRAEKQLIQKHFASTLPLPSNSSSDSNTQNTLTHIFTIPQAANTTGTTLLQRLNAHVAYAKHRANQYSAQHSAKWVIASICFIIFPIHLLKLLCLTFTVYLLGTIGLAAVRDLRMELYTHMQRINMNFFNREKTGAIMSRVVNDGEIVGRLLSLQFNEVLVDVFYIITHLAFLFWASWQTVVFIFILGPLLLIPTNNIARRIQRVAMKQQEHLGELTARLQEVLAGIRVIRAFAMEKFEYRRFRQTSQRLYKNTFLTHYYHQVGPALVEIMSVLVVLCLFIWGIHEIRQGRMTSGHFFAFFFAISFIMRPIKRVSIAINLISAASAAGTRIFQMLDRKIDVLESKMAQTFTTLRHKICYENVCFAYYDDKEKDGNDVLHDISFCVEQGESVALVGASGAGKSTLLDLLPRLHDVRQGCIRFDGVDIRQLRLADLRATMEVVSQDVFLFHGSINENIAYGRSDIARKEIERAAKDANAHEFIAKLPQAYDTMIGERGVMLSGGQQQRLAIARALLLDPAILILDEATSGLDNESEYLVQQALNRLCKGRTVFTIAHRASSLFHAQRILVLEQGRLVEDGTHTDLMQKQGVYYQLYHSHFLEAAQ